MGNDVLSRRGVQLVDGDPTNLLVMHKSRNVRKIKDNISKEKGLKVDGNKERCSKKLQDKKEFDVPMDKDVASTNYEENLTMDVNIRELSKIKCFKRK